MLPTSEKVSVFWRCSLEWILAPVSPKNLRLSAVLIAIYQLLVAHVLLFMVLLGLAHAEQMKTMLALDIQDQKEFGFYDLKTFPNQLRLTSASQLVSLTEELLYALTAIVAVYLLSALSLFGGVFKSRSEFILPWLLVDFIFMVMEVVMMFWLQNERFVEVIGGKFNYFAVGCTVLLFDALMWYIMHTFYQSLRTMSKLTEIATVAIPCPPPGAPIPFQFRKENMHLGSNGYKHILTESPDDVY